ncbi:MAG: hypothetical protein ACI4D7_07380, partial [Lachnospiraceae bacterium]
MENSSKKDELEVKTPAVRRRRKKSEESAAAEKTAVKAADTETKTAAKEETKTKAAAKTTAKAGTKTAAKTTVKANAKTKTAAKADTKTAVKTAEKKKTTGKEAAKKTVNEPVITTPFVTEMDQYLFGMGTHYEIYRKLGAHLCEKDGVKGVYFAVWAPNADYAAVIGEFNNWDRGAASMTRLEPMGIWEIFIPGVEEGMLYKYFLHTKNGWDLEKADPFASSAEVRPGTASRVAETENFKWTDKTWMNKRETFDVDSCPMAVYEVHPGSWKCHSITEDQKDYERFYNYREMAVELVP